MKNQARFTSRSMILALRQHPVLLTLGLGFAEFAVGRLFIALPLTRHYISAIWPPSGLALASLILFPSWVWPGIFLGKLAGGLSNGVALLPTLGTSAGGTLSALAGAWLLRRVNFKPSLERIRDVLALIFLGGLTASILSGLIGTLSLMAAGTVSSAEFFNVALTWWSGDSVGVMLITSVLLAWLAPSDHPAQDEPAQSALLNWGHVIEAVLLFLCLIGIAIPMYASSDSQFSYLVFPFLIWASVRFGLRGATLASTLVSLIAVYFFCQGKGSFNHYSELHGVLRLQAHLMIVITTSMVISLSFKAEILRRNLKAEQELRSKAESALAQLKITEEQLQQAVRVRDEFFSLASHELKTPLTSLRLHLELMELKGELSAPKSRLTGIHRQLDRFTSLIENLLDVTRMGNGRFQVEIARMDLVSAIRDMVARYQDELRSQNRLLEVRVEMSSLEGFWDRLRIEQVLSNLISNAIRYGGRSSVIVELNANEKTAHLVVRDHGPGIPLEDQDKIFNRFEQASGTPRSQGLGLGLYIVRQVVEAHSGSIHVESSPGQGAAFHVVLPLEPPQAIVRDTVTTGVDSPLKA